MMLPAVGEVSPLNVELFEAELSCILIKQRLTSFFKVSRKA